MTAEPRWTHWLGAAGALLLVVGSYIGLFVAPPERHMGDVGRILYVHLPSAKVCMMIYVLAFVLAIVSLWSGRSKWDARLVGAVEVGLVLNALLLIQGSIWARPTWGVWWDWDVRLTTSLVMFLLFAGVLALRSFVEEPGRRATWTAVATIVAFADVPLVYFCVRWWRSMHQVQSSPETVDSAMLLPLRLNLVGMLLLSLALIGARAALEMHRQRQQEVVEPPRIEPLMEARGDA